MRESIVVICPTAQGESRAALWHDGQIKHGWHARVARRAQITRAASRRIGRLKRMFAARSAVVLGRDMSHELTIRTAGRNDLPSLLELYGQLHPDDETVPLAEASRILAQCLRYSGSAIFVGLRDDAVVATCTLIVIPNLTRGGTPYALIENVVTHAQYRKRGYGKAILEAAISAAWRHGCYKVMLLTGSKDPATLAFYEDAGFEQTKTGFQMRRASP
jgi:GNAT superfamily N-acetyltransferase